MRLASTPWNYFLLAHGSFKSTMWFWGMSDALTNGAKPYPEGRDLPNTQFASSPAGETHLNFLFFLSVSANIPPPLRLFPQVGSKEYMNTPKRSLTGNQNDSTPVPTREKWRPRSACVEQLRYLEETDYPRPRETLICFCL